MYMPGRGKAKERPRFNRKTGVAFTPKGTAHIENLIRDRAMEWMAEAGLEEPWDGPVRLVVIHEFDKPGNYFEGKTPGHGFGDWDNLAKTVSDGMNHIVYKDDAQIIDGRSIKRYADAAGIHIAVELLPKATPLTGAEKRALTKANKIGEAIEESKKRRGKKNA